MEKGCGDRFRSGECARTSDALRIAKPRNPCQFDIIEGGRTSVFFLLQAQRSPNSGGRVFQALLVPKNSVFRHFGEYNQCFHQVLESKHCLRHFLAPPSSVKWVAGPGTAWGAAGCTFMGMLHTGWKVTFCHGERKACTFNAMPFRAISISGYFSSCRMEKTAIRQETSSKGQQESHWARGMS